MSKQIEISEMVEFIEWKISELYEWVVNGLTNISIDF